ncbi:MAG: hypothetical protein HKN87_20420 [Saprospiraceae bacterium]|nr:hypothetical protein [Saprospiraceae bacterium]
MANTFIEKCKVLYAAIFCIYSLSLIAYTDESHYSEVFQEVRNFRVFTPQDYLTEGKRYAVIYYFHGCGGSYRRSGPYSYADYGLTAPDGFGNRNDPDFAYANNADFENVADAKQVIIVCVDGKLEDLPADGCRVYFPSLAEEWKRQYYNFSDYIKELIAVVDSRYRTMPGSNQRAVMGLSMGGHMATWVAATNPQLFSSASHFCYGPSFYKVGEPPYQTTVDLKQLWRNFRGVPFRHATTDRDYLRYYSKDLSNAFQGAGFENDFYLADYCHHAAARVDLQVDFHQSHFGTREEVSCFSYVNFYPEFTAWGYDVTSDKLENGWIYLHDVTSNGFGIYTRKRLPWGLPMESFDIKVTTPSLYRPGLTYTIARFDYGDGQISTYSQVADEKGRLSLTSKGGHGQEIGIGGSDLQPPIFVLSDPVNEMIYLESGESLARSLDVINLSESKQRVEFVIATEDTAALVVVRKRKYLILPPLSRTRIDSFLVIEGNLKEKRSDRAYIKVGSTIGGQIQDRTQLLPVQVYKNALSPRENKIQAFDGKSKELPVFSYAWNEWDEPLRVQTITEGKGNGNGIVETGDTFSLWIQLPEGFDDRDVLTWHPILPLYSSESEGFELIDLALHRFNTGREIQSGLIRLTRTPTRQSPIVIPFQTELLKVEPLEDDCHRPAADNFDYFYGEIILDGSGLKD